MKIKILSILRVLYVWLYCSLALANDTFQDGLIFKKYTFNDGLIQNSVRAILKDSNGFMWFGTENGLSRFDGYEFVNFWSKENNPHTLSGNRVMDIVEDKQGKVLWIATLNGLSKYDIRTNSLYRIDNHSHSPKEKYFLSERIRCLFYDVGKLWIGTEKGLSILSTKNKSLSAIDLSHVVEGVDVRTIAKDDNAHIWLGTRRNGLIKIDTSNDQVQVLPIILSQDESHNNIRKVIVDNNILWIATKNLVIKYHQLTGEFEEVNLPENLEYVPKKDNNDIYDMLLHDKQLWIASNGGGLYKYGTNSGVFEHIVSKDIDIHGLSNNQLVRLYLSDDNLWVSTFGKGINYLDIGGGIQLIRKQVDENSLVSNQVFSIVSDQEKNIWFATDKGITVRKKLDKSYKHFRGPGKTSMLLYEKDVGVWGASDSGLYIINENSWNIENITTQILDLDQHSEIRAIATYGDNKLLIGTNNGLVVWDQQTGSSKKIQTQIDQDHFDDRNTVREIFVDNNDVLVGTKIGLYKVDWSDKVLLPYTVGNYGKIFDELLITTIKNDQSNNLLVASMDGLYKLVNNRKKYEKLTKSQGLPDNNVRGIISQDNNIWLSTDAGMALITNMESGEFKIKRLNRDFLNNEFYARSAHLLDSDTYLFGSSSGVLVLKPLLMESKQPKTVAITSFKINNADILYEKSVGLELLNIRKTIQFGGDLNLKYYQNNFSIKFSSLSYRDNKKIYAYKLENYDEKYISTDYKDRHAVYTNLSPGIYILKIKVGNAETDINDSENPYRLKIRIQPPWWKTLWMYIAYAIILVLFIWGIIKFRTLAANKRAKILELVVRDRTKEISEKKETIEKLLEEKAESFAFISHELRTPISLILGPIKRALAKIESDEARSDLQIVKRNTERLFILVDQLLELSRLDYIPDEEKKPHNLSKIAEIISSFFQPMAAERDILFSIDVKGNIWVRALPNILESILMNLLSNAIKYTNAGGVVLLSVSDDGDKNAVIKVDDSGIGIEESKIGDIFERFVRLEDAIELQQKGSGIGLSIVKRFVESHDGSIKVSSEKDIGSQFMIYLSRCYFENEEENEISIHETTLRHLHYLNHIKQDEFEYLQPDTNNLHDAPTLLIIDDTPDMCRYLVDLLGNYYQCIIANDGESGVEQAEKYIPDIILCDIMMPKKDGFEVLEYLRNTDTTSHIPILMITAYGGKQRRLKANQYYADDFIDKPFDDEILISKLESIFAVNKLRQHKVLQLAQSETKDNEEYEEINISPRDQEFIKKWQAVIAANFSDINFKVDKISDLMHMADRTIQYKVRKLFGKTRNEYLREYRLQQSIEVMKNEDISIGLLAERVGFATQEYFSRCFRNYYGMNPNAYKKALFNEVDS